MLQFIICAYISAPNKNNLLKSSYALENVTVNFNFRRQLKLYKIYYLIVNIIPSRLVPVYFLYDGLQLKSVGGAFFTAFTRHA